MVKDLMTLMLHGGRGIMNLITGIFLVFTFVAIISLWHTIIKEFSIWYVINNVPF